MLKQVCEAGLAVGFIGRTDAVPHADKDSRYRVVGMYQYGQSVIEPERFVLNLDLAGDVVRCPDCRRCQKRHYNDHKYGFVG